MFVKHLEIIIKSARQHKALIAVCLFEECYFDAFLSASEMGQPASGTLAYYLSLAPFFLLLIGGMAMAHLSGAKKVKPMHFSSKKWEIIKKIKVWQKRFPITATLGSIAVIILSEWIEQALLTWVFQYLFNAENLLLLISALTLWSFIKTSILIFIIHSLILPIQVIENAIIGSVHSDKTSTFQLLNQQIAKLIKHLFKHESQPNHRAFNRLGSVHPILSNLGFKAHCQSFTSLCPF